MKHYLRLFLLIPFVFNLNVGKANPPDEGMWLPLLIKSLNYKSMQDLGCKLTPEQIYSVNNSSLKDAVVQLGGFCTAEIVSDKGLIFTNHHCAYDAIQTHSSVENDYLTDGFWAKEFEDEKFTEGLTVSILVRMEDVTSRIMDKVAAAEEGDGDAALGEEIMAIETEAAGEENYRTEVKSMFFGNQYFLFVYETFTDIRLVGAPPNGIGKFGGDTDNWMWPRHTGDFSMLRIYADKDNKPADYSVDNVPYKPKHFLPISLKGVNEGDFSMIMGYPGSTDRYLTSHDIKDNYENVNPDIINILGKRLNIMKEGMDADEKVRIQLASTYASLSNTYKYYVGQTNGLRKRGLVEEKAQFESEFESWVGKDNKRKEKYDGVLNDISDLIGEGQKIGKLSNYLNMAGFGPGFVPFGIKFYRLGMMMEKADGNSSVYQASIDGIKEDMEGHFKDYAPKVDKKVFAEMLRLMKNDLSPENHLSVFKGKNWLKAKPKGNIDQFQAYANNVFAKSILVSPAKIKAFLAAPSLKVLQKDPGYEYILSVIDLYRNKMAGPATAINAKQEEGMKTLQAGRMAMQTDKKFYPDANFTMRLTYGTVKPYIPRDAVEYDFFTTTDGIIEKENPKDEEFIAPPKLLDLIKNKDFGRYANSDGEMRVCFLTDHDITGGNSGSPVINGNGELTGIAFDGNWESMTSDLVFDEEVVRTINVDIRYVLFVMDKFANAQRLVNELKIVK